MNSYVKKVEGRLVGIINLENQFQEMEKGGYVYSLHLGYPSDSDCIYSNYSLCNQEILDIFVDIYEGVHDNLFYTDKEIIENDIYEDEYIVCGNHCLNLSIGYGIKILSYRV